MHLVARGLPGSLFLFLGWDGTNLLACLLASIQPRTSPSKFGGKFNSLFIRLLNEVSMNKQLLEVVEKTLAERDDAAEVEAE